MAKLQVFDNKQEVEKPLDMIKGGTSPVNSGNGVKNHNMAAMSNRLYPKKSQMPGAPDTGMFPDSDLRGDTSKAL
jgi:hypothetical protein